MTPLSLTLLFSASTWTGETLPRLSQGYVCEKNNLCWCFCKLLTQCFILQRIFFYSVYTHVGKNLSFRIHQFWTWVYIAEMCWVGVGVGLALASCTFLSNSMLSNITVTWNWPQQKYLHLIYWSTLHIRASWFAGLQELLNRDLERLDRNHEKETLIWGEYVSNSHVITGWVLIEKRDFLLAGVADRLF